MPAHLISDLAIAWAAAFVGGTIAQRLRQPPILGYLLAGVVLGPFTPGPVIEASSIEIVADIGVAFLMFALGTEFSFRELADLGRVVAIGGPLQILCTMALGPLLAAPLGLSFPQGVFLGGLLALSSTVVALKVLAARGLVQSLGGKIALGLLIAQDLAVVPMVVILPILTGRGGASLVGLGLIAVKAAAVFLGVLVVGTRLVPWILERAVITQTRELFILGVVGLALGTAILTQAIGLSLAFGAFLAGLAVSESPYRTQALAEVLPLRDLFISLFFVSIGLLIQPATLVSEVGLVVLAALAVVVGKAVIVTAITMLLGISGRVALIAGLGVAQIGEFSFVLGQLGLTTHAIPPATFDLILGTAVVSIVASPFLIALAPRLLQVLRGLPLPSGWFAEPVGVSAETEALAEHTVIGGYGRVGQEVARALDQESLPYLVIEYNPAIVRQLQEAEVPVLYGDAGNPLVLEHAHLDRARLFAVLVPDPTTAEAATRAARALSPTLDILARANDERQAEILRQAGATSVVQPEFEAGVMVVGHALRRYGRSGPELARLILERRASFYRRGR